MTLDLATIRAALDHLPEQCRHHSTRLDRPGPFGPACCDTGAPALARRNALQALDQLHHELAVARRQRDDAHAELAERQTPAPPAIDDIEAELAATSRALREAWEQHLATTPVGSSPYTAEAVGILALRTQALAALASLPERQPGYVITLPSGNDDPKADRRLRERISEAIGRDPIYILAKDGEDARRWAAGRIREKDWRLMTRDAARGRSRIRLARVGSWRDNADLAEIERNLEIVRSAGSVEDVSFGE